MIARLIGASVLAMSAWLSAGPAAAQTAGASQPGSPKPVRKPVQNLQDEAKRHRESEIVPAAAPPPKNEPATKPPAPPIPDTAPTPAPKADEAATPAPPADQTPVKARGTPIRSPQSPTPPDEGAMHAESPGRRAPAGVIVLPQQFEAGGKQFVAFDAIVATVDSISGEASLVQFRRADDDPGNVGQWQQLNVGTELRGRFEVRTGLGASVRLLDSAGAACTIGELTRVRIERRVRADGTSHPAIGMARGRVACVEAGGTSWIVRTQQGVYAIQSAAVQQDAIHGTEILP
ncbi:MAG: hypothetical protein AB7G11_08590 [Phycisphaerales bacterium]